MSHFKSLRFSEVAHEVPISRHLGISHLNSPSVAESDNGCIFSVMQCEGVAFETEQTEKLNQCWQQWHAAVQSLDENYAIWGTLHRRCVKRELAGQFNNPLARDIDRQYQLSFDSTPFFINDLYVTVIYRGLMSVKSSALQFKRKRQVARAAAVKELTQRVDQLQAMLSEFSPVRLGDEGESSHQSSLLAFLSLVVNGGQAQHLVVPQHASMIDKSVYDVKRMSLSYPQGHLSPYLSTKQLWFGENIQFQGADKSDCHFAAMLSLKRYASHTASVMLDPLLRLPCEFIATHSFAVESKTQADQLMARHANKMQNVDDPATSQYQAIIQARDELASDHLLMGVHHNSVMVLGGSEVEVDQAVHEIIKAYSHSHVQVVRETLGQEPAFWAQIPSNFKWIARGSLISSKNFADFFPLHNYRTGSFNENHLGGALTLVETPARTPLWLNLHANGPKDNPVAGHATLIGGNGSGKTVTMCFLDAQLNRYGGSSVFFDRNRGTEIYIRASGGQYFILSPTHADAVAFNPLQLKDTPANRNFCKQWVVQLVRREDEKEVDDETIAQMHHCIDYAFDQLSPQHRSLTHACKVLPINFNRWSRLRRWLRADKQYGEGEYAYLFDQENDDLNLDKKTGFDLTHFLDNEPSEVLTAVMMYLLHRVECELNGQLMSVFLDEAWQYFNNIFWQKKLKQWLPTLRKQNCHLVMATQSPKSVIDSSLSHVVLDNCASQLYFANPQAKQQQYCQGFNLTETEYLAIRQNVPQSRLFLYKQGRQSYLARLNLQGLKQYLRIFSATAESVGYLDQLRARLGSDPEIWLPAFYRWLQG